MEMIKQITTAALAVSLGACAISYTPASEVRAQKQAAKQARIAQQQAAAAQARLDLENSIIKHCKENLELTPYKDVESCVTEKTKEIRAKEQAAKAKQRAYRAPKAPSTSDIIKRRAIERSVDKLFGR